MMMMMMMIDIEDAYVRQFIHSQLLQTMACRLFGIKPLSDQTLIKKINNLRMPPVKWWPFGLGLSLLCPNIYGDIDLGQHWLGVWLVAWGPFLLTWFNFNRSQLG